MSLNHSNGLFSPYKCTGKYKVQITNAGRALEHMQIRETYDFFISKINRQRISQLLTCVGLLVLRVSVFEKSDQQNNFHDKSLFNKNNRHVKSTCCIGLNMRMLVIMTLVIFRQIFKTLQNIMEIS